MAWRPTTGSTDGPAPVVVGLNRVLAGFEAPSAQTLQPLFENWDELVGDSIAAHTRPVSLRGSTLTVAVDDPAWASQLRWMGSELLERLAEGLGDGVVTDLEVRMQRADRGRRR